MLVTATPNKASYARGEVVKITAAAENRSGHSCAPADPSLEVRDSTGAPVFNVSVIDMFTFGVEGQPMPTWDPGKALSTTFDWADTCPPAYAVGSCPAGTYTVVVRFGPYVSAPSPITLT